MQRHKTSAGIQLLLLEDVHGLGRKGDIATAKPGFARNFLVPRGKALLANANALRKQENLQTERAKQATVDLTVAKELASRITGLTLSTNVKVSGDGTLYGSVGPTDVVEVLKGEGIEIDRHDVRLGQPIKATGLHEIPLQLKEGVTCSFNLKVLAEGMDELPAEAAEVVAPIEEEAEVEPEEEEGESS